MHEGDQPFFDSNELFRQTGGLPRREPRSLSAQDCPLQGRWLVLCVGRVHGLLINGFSKEQTPLCYRDLFMPEYGRGGGGGQAPGFFDLPNPRLLPFYPPGVLSARVVDNRVFMQFD